ncbi:MAG: hypothetical protein ACOCRO_04320, partial [Halanaerobiales bacterium]
MQRLVPANKLGRVSGTLRSLYIALSSLGIIAGGILVDLINPWIFTNSPWSYDSFCRLCNEQG